MDATLIPPVGQLIPGKLLESKHPRHDRLLEALYFWRTTYEGSGGYEPHMAAVTLIDRPPADDGSLSTIRPAIGRETMLWRHPREQEKFTRRVMMAYNLNVVRKVVTSLVGFLMRKPPSRDDYPDSVRAWMGKASTDGLSWDQVLRVRVAPLLMTYGWLPVLVHYDTTEALTAAVQRERGGPFATVINPESILDWCEDGRGGFLWLKFREEVDQTSNPLAEDRTVVQRTHWITQAGWWFCDHAEGASDAPVVASGTWPGSTMPLAVWRLAGGSLLTGAASVQRELFNVLSLEQEQERDTAFSMLVMEDPGKGRKTPTQAVGSDNALLVREGCQTKPYWLTSDVKALDHYEKKIQRLIGQILSEFSLEFDEGAASGVALSFKMSKVTRLLVDLSSAFAVGETATHRHVAEALGEAWPDDAASVWPKRYDETDIEREMKSLSDLLLMDPGPTFAAVARYRAAQAALPDLDEATLEAGWQDIEDEEKDRHATDAQMALLREKAIANNAGQTDAETQAIQGGPEPPTAAPAGAPAP